MALAQFEATYRTDLQKIGSHLFALKIEPGETLDQTALLERAMVHLNQYFQQKKSFELQHLTLRAILG